MSNIIDSHFYRDDSGHIVGCDTSQADLEASYLPIWKLWFKGANDDQQLDWATREGILRKDRELGLFELADSWVTCLCGRKSRLGTVTSFFAHYYLEHTIDCKAIQ